MVKATSPIFSEIHGGIKNVDFRTRRNRIIEIGRKRTPYNPQTEAQQNHRALYAPAVKRWKEMDEELREQWGVIASLSKISGYNAYMKEALRDCRLYYPFYEGEGSTLHDLSGYNNHGTIYGATWDGKALVFDGINDYIDSGNDASLNITDAITIGVRIKNTGDIDAYILARKNALDWNKAIAVHFQASTDKIRFLGDNAVVVASDAVFTRTDWIHVVVVANQGGTTYFYKNGVPTGSDTTPTWSISDEALFIGARMQGAGLIDPFNGTINKARIYGTAQPP